MNTLVKATLEHRIAYRFNGISTLIPASQPTCDEYFSSSQTRSTISTRAKSKRGVWRN